ncbi:MAG TPA: cupin domain-containing protein [bacterium]|nr:cupin domain-containing protein [bacterium]
MNVVTLEDLRSFDPAKMKKNNLFETSRFFADLYCLEPGQAQAPHTHEGSDKVYVVLEGEGTFLVGSEEASLEAGQAVLAESGAVHGVANEGPDRLICLVFMAPHPAPPAN